MDRLFTALDIYCERNGCGFLVGARQCTDESPDSLRRLFRPGTGAFPENRRLRESAVLVGGRHRARLASFHTTAIELTKWADIIPIATFTLAMSIFCLRRFSGLNWPKTAAYFISYFALISIITWLIPSWLSEATNGTTAYLPRAWPALPSSASWR